MIDYYIYEQTYHLFGIIPIQLWGVLVALGFLAGVFVSRIVAAHRGLDNTVFYDVFTWIFIGAMLGARIWEVLFYWPADTPRTLLDMIAIWNGGMAFFGGLLGAMAGGYLFVRKHGLSFWAYADAIAPGLALGHAIGRVGCYLTGLHTGVETTVPWALHFLNGPLQGQLRHPVVLYEIIYLLIIFVVLWAIHRRAQLGTLSAVYGLLYGTARFVNDFFRDTMMDPTYFGLTATQYGLLVVVAVSAGYLLFRKMHK